MQTTPEMIRLAKEAAAKVEAKLLDMMATNEQGEVAAILGYNYLDVEGRPRQNLGHRKLERGHWQVIEKVKQT